MRTLFWTMMVFVSGTTQSAVAETLYAPQQPQLAPSPYNLHLQNFAEVRDELLKLITKAKRRVWLATDYLTDGEIVTALYLAKYRSLDVQVLLGREKANQYLSRLHYLKKQDTPVSLKPEGFTAPAPTAILIDQDLFILDSDLDFRRRGTSFALRSVGPKEAGAFADEFAESTGKEPAVANEMPLVGRAGNGRPRGAPWLPPRSGKAPPPTIPAALPLMPSSPAYTGEQDGSFNYNKNGKGQGPASGVPRALPKTLKSRQGQNGAR